MNLVADTQKGATWLSQFITDNGMVKVLAIGFLGLLVLIGFAFARRWVVFRSEAEIYKAQAETYKQQVDNLTAVMTAGDTRDMGKIVERLDVLTDGAESQQRDHAVQIRLQEETRDVLREVEIRTRGGGRSAQGSGVG